MAASGLLASQVTPYIEEKSVFTVTVLNGDTDVIVANLPTIHATVIDVIVQSTGANVGVDLIQKCAAGTIQIVDNLGNVAAGTTGGFTYGHSGPAGQQGPIGQVCSLQIDNSGGGANATITAWICARS